MLGQQRLTHYTHYGGSLIWRGSGNVRKLNKNQTQVFVRCAVWSGSELLTSKGKLRC